MNDELYMGLGLCVYDLLEEDLAAIGSAFNKVWRHLDNLRCD